MPKFVQFVNLEGTPIRLSGVVLLMESVKQVYCCDEALDYTIRALNASDVEKVIIVPRGVSPYTLRLDGKSEEEARDLSKASEIEWLVNAKKYLPHLEEHVTDPSLRERLSKVEVSDALPLTQLTKHYEIKLWEDVIADPRFAVIKSKLWEQYHAEKNSEESVVTAGTSLDCPDSGFEKASKILAKLTRRKALFFKTISDVADTFLASYIGGVQGWLTEEDAARMRRDGPTLCIEHVIEERATDVLLAREEEERAEDALPVAGKERKKKDLKLAYPFKCSGEIGIKLAKLIKGILSENSTSAVPIVIDFVGFGFTPVKKRKSRSPKLPLAIQVTPPASGGAAKADDEPRSEELEDEGGEKPENKRLAGKKAALSSRGRSASAPKRVEGLSVASVPISISRRSSDLERFAEERRESPEEFGKMLERYLKDPKYGREYFSALLITAAKYSSILTEPMPQCAPLAKPPVALTVSPPKEPPRDLSGPTLRKTKSAGPESSFFRHGERVAKSEEVSESTAQKVR